MRRYTEPQYGPDARLGVEHGGDRPMLDVCLSEGDAGQVFLVAYLIVGDLDPVLVAAATDGGAIARSPHMPVPAEDLSPSERERFTKDVEAVGAALYARVVVIHEDIWEDQEAAGATDGDGATSEVPITATTDQAILVCREALSLLLAPNPNIPDTAREAVLSSLDISDDYARACVKQLDTAFPHDGSGWQ